MSNHHDIFLSATSIQISRVRGGIRFSGRLLSGGGEIGLRGEFIVTLDGAKTSFWTCVVVRIYGAGQD